MTATAASLSRLAFLYDHSLLHVSLTLNLLLKMKRSNPWLSLATELLRAFWLLRVATIGNCSLEWHFAAVSLEERVL